MTLQRLTISLPRNTQSTRDCLIGRDEIAIQTVTRSARFLTAKRCSPSMCYMLLTQSMHPEAITGNKVRVAFLMKSFRIEKTSYKDWKYIEEKLVVHLLPPKKIVRTRQARSSVTWYCSFRNTSAQHDNSTVMCINPTKSRQLLFGITKMLEEVRCDAGVCTMSLCLLQGMLFLYGVTCLNYCSTLRSPRSYIYLSSEGNGNRSEHPPINNNGSSSHKMKNAFRPKSNPHSPKSCHCCGCNSWIPDFGGVSGILILKTVVVLQADTAIFSLFSK